MPVKRRIGKARHLDPYRREQLLMGPDTMILAGMGYLGPHGASQFDHLTSEQQGQVLATMREDWATYGAEMMGRWRRGEYEPDMKPWTFVIPGGLDRDPWALTEFGEP